MKVHTAITLTLMSVVIVALLIMSYIHNTDRVTTMSYQEFQRIW